jgi:alcohol dehydrogenase
MLDMIVSGRLRPERLIGGTLSLGEAAVALTEMNSFAGTGVSVIDSF